MFRSLFGKPNPTRDWQPHSGQPLTFDLDASSLNDGKLGQGLECLSFLGPDEDRKSFRDGEFCYYSLGLCVECHGSEYTITGYHIVFRDPDDHKYKPFAGRVIRNGQTSDFAALTLDTCAETLGDYFWIHCDEWESIVFYEFTGREWQLEFDKDTSSLKRLILTNRPLMADEAQRRAYNVTKPWPPNI